MYENEQIAITDDDIKRIRYELMTNGNDSDYGQVIEQIAHEDPRIMLPIMTQVLFDEGRTMSESDWSFRAEDICNHLGHPSLRHLAELLLPALIAVIASRYDERKIDVGYAIDAMNQFDMQSFPSVIPVLLNFIQRDKTWLDARIEAWKIIRQFDNTALLPYTLIIQSIQADNPNMIS